MGFAVLSREIEPQISVGIHLPFPHIHDYDDYDDYDDYENHSTKSNPDPIATSPKQSTAMAVLLPQLQRTLLLLCSTIFFLSSLTSALKLDLEANKPQRCIRNFVAKDTLVVVTATVGGSRGDGMTVNMHVKDAVGNEYGRPRDVAGEQRILFTSHDNSAFDVCFENLLTGGKYTGPALRHVELDIDIGADAKDWSAIQATEKLKPVETELRRIEELVQEIVREMDYLRSREQKLRDTNESTNTRVKWFGFGTTSLLVGLWVWQILYLRAYFRSKHLI
ncbi:putative endoplasmic reticulum vesicle protein 25 protein [Zalerion maritima]|uniref:Endoplasmic reticulum vesicle protein 25 protein n=1 Tax=Zalerion maritima TaxID=339359 RepID=A0AAD5RPT9_9PEZI|nr:putative endoplasmic reticulum vesicle protein 25 protein [Zalerion maritima]